MHFAAGFPRLCLPSLIYLTTQTLQLFALTVETVLVRQQLTNHNCSLPAPFFSPGFIDSWFQPLFC